MQFTVSFAHDMNSIPAARRAIDRIADEVDDVVLRNARLVVSELVTNVIRHVPDSSGDLQLSVDAGDGHLRVEVLDRGPGFTPAPRADNQDPSSGWGLHILARTASRWGVESDGGTRVWFEMDGAADRSASAA